MFLKQRFLKDQKFFDNYKEFMDNLPIKGYAKQSEVVLTGKPGIFNINREHLTGPDLTNQIMGIMTTFREEEIAFMADIEAMYL